MIENKLILFTRAGCCLCEGLEERLKQLSLTSLNPALMLFVKDIDGNDISNLERARYSLEVPVLLVELEKPYMSFELPRVSPRLSEEGLFLWLKKVIKERMKTN